MYKKQNISFGLGKPKTLSTAVALALGLTLPYTLVSSASAQEELEEIVVTGSRIVRRDYEATSPIVTIESEVFDQTSGIGIESALNQLPQYTPGQTQFSSTDVQPSAFNTPGIASLNLRGIGANRNLILIDGRRAQPSNAQLVVDVNSIPSAAIESVEVITGGASAVYGADAMAGVTNFKLKRDFEGFNLDIQTSATEQGGGEETRISALIGAGLGDGGNVMLGISTAERQAIAQADRDFYVKGWRDPNTTGGNTVPYTSFVWSRTNPVSQTALDTIFGPGVAAPSDNVYANPDGSSVFINSAASGAAGYTGPLNDELKILGPETSNPGTLSANNLDALVTTPLERYSIFARANYDISDNMNVFLQANFSHMQVDTVLNYAPAASQWNASIPMDGRALPAELQTLLDSRADPTANWTLERQVDFVGPRRSTNSTDVYQVLAGLEGRFGDTSWTYEAYASHGETTLVSEMQGFPGTQNFRSVVQAPDFGQNLSVGVGPPLFYELTCETGLPIFDDFTPSQDCIDSLNTNMKHLTDLEQNIMEVNVTGNLFELPAGTLQAAFGASTRENKYRWRPDFQLTRPSTNFPIGLFPSSNTAGQVSVDELYAEFLVPVISEIPAIQELNLELGARWSDYNTAGEIWTYKALVDWSINDNFRVRGGYQLANRAPNVAELFTGPTTAVVGFPGADPCMANTTNEWGNTPLNTTNRAQVIDLCSQIINNSGANNDSDWHLAANYPDAIVGPFPFNFPLELANITGNQSLDSEEGETLTLGVIMNSPFGGIFENLTLALDWYQIEITDAISPTDAYNVYAKCLNEDGSNPNYEFNEFCGLIFRDPANGYRATVDTPYFNLGGIETSGIDMQLNWGIDLAGGFLSITSNVNWLDYYREQQNPDDDFTDFTGTLGASGQFDYRVLSNFNFIKDDWSVGVRHRFLPSIEAAAYAVDPMTTFQGAGSYHMFDAFGSYMINETFTVRGGIDNLFDTDPEIVNRQPGFNNAQGTTSPGYYDPIGRRYYVAVQMNF